MCSFYNLLAIYVLIPGANTCVATVEPEPVTTPATTTTTEAPYPCPLPAEPPLTPGLCAGNIPSREQAPTYVDISYNRIMVNCPDVFIEVNNGAACWGTFHFLELVCDTTINKWRAPIDQTGTQLGPVSKVGCAV